MEDRWPWSARAALLLPSGAAAAALSAPASALSAPAPTTRRRAATTNCPRSLLRSLVLLPLALLVLLLAVAGPGSPRGALGARRSPAPTRLTGAAAICARRTKRAACGADALTVACGGPATSSTTTTTATPTCPDARSTPCRVMAGGQTTTCAGGVQFSLASAAVAPPSSSAPAGVRLVRVAPAAENDARPPVYVSGPVTARGAGGSCSYPAPAGGSVLGSASLAAAGAAASSSSSLLRAPATTVAYVDLCVCSPTAIDFAAPSGGDARAEQLLALGTNPTPLLPAPLCPSGRGQLAAVELPNLTASDDCGRDIAVTIEVASAPDAASEAALLRDSGLRPGGSVSRQGLACGQYELSYMAALPDGGDLLSAKDFTFEVLCDGLPDVGVLGGPGETPPVVPTCL